MLKKLDRRLTLGALAGAGLGLFGLCVFSLALMRPAAAQAPEPPEAPTTNVIALNPRWLQLVRGPAPKPGFAPAQAQSPQTLNVLLTDHTVAGRASNGSTVYISHTRGITLVASGSVRPVLDGSSFFYAAQLPNLYICPPGQGCFTPNFEPGDEVQVSQGSSLLTTTIPMLSALAYSKEDAVRGSAPASQTVSVLWYSAANPDLTATRIATATATGDYAVSFSGVADVRARDSGFVLLTVGANTTIAQQFVAPFLRAQVRGSQISGKVLPYRIITIQVTDATSNTRYAAGYAGPDGSFSTILSYVAADVLKPGDVVRAVADSQEFSMTVEDISTSASYSQAQVIGLAPANRLVDLEVIPGPLSESFGFNTSYTPTQSRVITASATGHYSAAITFQAGDYGYANLSDTEGHQSFTRFVLPYARARMGNAVFTSNYFADVSPLIGQLETFASPLTVTVQSKRGYTKDIRSAYASFGTGFFIITTNYDENYSNPQGLFAAGDVVTVASPLGAHLVFKLPAITAFANLSTDVVTGTAPPNAVLRVSLGNGYAVPYPIVDFATPTPPAPGPDGTAVPPAPTPYPTNIPLQANAVNAKGSFTLPPYPPQSAIIASQWVTATADGTFTATFANLADITGQSVGEVEWISAEGYAALQPFRAQGSCAPRLVTVNLSSSAFYINQDPNCAAYQVRLLDAQGVEKGLTYLQGSFGGKAFQQPVLPGDTLELISGGQTQRTRIPSMSVVLDPVAETISGTLLPNKEIAVVVNNIANSARYIYTGSAYFTGTVGADGLFTRSLSGTLDIVPGSLAQITVGEAPGYVIEGAVPWMRAYLYNSLLDVAISDASTASVTVRAAGAITPTEPMPIVWGPYAPSYQLFLQRSIVPGDQITIKSKQQVVSLTVPNLSARLDLAQRRITGKAPPNASLLVLVYPQNFTAYTVVPPTAIQHITATATGAFTATFTNTDNLAPNATLFYVAPNGSEVVLNVGAPRWSVALGEPFVSGQSVSGGGQMTLTLRSASGTVKSRVPVGVDPFGYFSAFFTATIAGGDRIELAQPGDTQVFVVPAFSAAHDAGRNILQGKVLPNMSVQVTLSLNPTQGGYFQATRRTQADAAGNFILDTADLPLQLRGQGQMLVSDADGNTIRVSFVVSGHLRFLPMVLR